MENFRDHWIKKIVKTLLSPIEYSGPHRLPQWEKGWQQNLDEDTIVPHYFGKYPVVREDGELVTASSNYEHIKLMELETNVFTKYLSYISTVYEFGCGTGHNLSHLQTINSSAELWGMDWANSGVESVKRLGFNGKQFDFFHPEGIIKPESGILTVAALEQTGDKFRPFVHWLIEQKPSIVVHLEPIEELLDPNNLLDYLCLAYMKKRKYLTGYLTYLHELEKAGDISIVEASRNGIGSLFMEGYMVVVWRPV